MTNPAVQKLFADVDNPVLASTVIHAVRQQQVLHVERIPSALLEPVFILASVAQLFQKQAVDDYPLLRKRLGEEIAVHNHLVRILLTGAGFQNTPPRYPERAFLNCMPGEVRLEFLPIGMRFRSGNKFGVLVYKTPSRAVVDWEGQRQERTFTDHRTAKEVTIAGGSKTTGCALDAGVVPIYSVVNDEDRAWATNAWKELTGVFSDKGTGNVRPGGTGRLRKR